MIKDELVKRFESVVKQEIKDHEKSIQETNKELVVLSGNISTLKVTNSSIKQEYDKKITKLEQLFISESKKRDDEFQAQREYLADRTKKLDSIIETLEKQVENLIDKDFFDAFQKELEFSFIDANKLIGMAVDTCNTQSFDQYKKNTNLIEKVKEQTELNFSMLENRTQFLDNKVRLYIEEVKGVSRMMKSDEKSLFIVEKKIENLYTIHKRLKDKIDAKS